MTRWIVFLVTAITGLILDLGTKYWAFQMSGLEYNPMGKRQIITVIPGWFDFSLAMNTGAAFSMFSGRFTFFMIISVVAFLTLIYFVHVAEPKEKLQPFIIGLIFAGVVGNFWDRVVFEGVRDFIVWHTPDEGFLFLSQRHEWPTFNVADIWICVGAIAMAGIFWVQEENPPAAAEALATAPSTEESETSKAPSEADAPASQESEEAAKQEAAATPNKPHKKKKKKKKRR